MDLPLYFLFGALTALFLSAAFLFQLTAQAREAVDERAWGLLEGLARTAFSLLPNEETEVELPPSLAGCSYEFWVEGNSLHLRILDGVRKGKEYSLQLAEGVRVENSSFGERIYLRREGRGLKLKAKIEAYCSRRAEDMGRSLMHSSLARLLPTNRRLSA